ncbi:hypothetical protein [Sorangium sp. So ce1389]|uniref:hypothetical protein n=1 Tax=Sorangium sp. So ce1389 TaxID=3133336 RepID=UPI003F634B5D
MWTKKKLLIWGKTYPEFSRTYYETVCTGAVDGETGRLVRIYPIPLRYMTEPFKKYDWIEAEIERNSSDFRPESFRIRQDTIKVVGHLDPDDGWKERNQWVLRDGNVFSSVEALQAAEKKDHTSLGMVKPKQILRVYCKRRPDSDRVEWEQHRAQALAQRDLFVDAETETKDLQFMPVQYRACFRCDDPGCTTEHDLSILDWELYQLSRKQYAQRGAAQAERDVIKKVEDQMDPGKRDPYFFLGNTKAHSNSFMIVGLYYPARDVQKSKRPPETGTLKFPGF